MDPSHSKNGTEVKQAGRLAVLRAVTCSVSGMWGVCYGQRHPWVAGMGVPGFQDVTQLDGIPTSSPPLSVCWNFPVLSVICHSVTLRHS